MRHFFALDISQRDKATIEKWRQQQVNLSGKAVTQNNLHITLAFLGAIDNKQQVSLIQQTDAYFNTSPVKNESPKREGKSLTLNKLELFQKPQVLYLNLTSTPDWLSQLASDLSNQAKILNIQQESRPYIPHLSLYRKIKCLSEKIKSIQCNLDITIHSFSLYHSYYNEKGLIYQPVKTWSLE